MKNFSKMLLASFLIMLLHSTIPAAELSTWTADTFKRLEGLPEELRHTIAMAAFSTNMVAAVSKIKKGAIFNTALRDYLNSPVLIDSVIDALKSNYHIQRSFNDLVSVQSADPQQAFNDMQQRLILLSLLDTRGSLQKLHDMKRKDHRLKTTFSTLINVFANILPSQSSVEQRKISLNIITTIVDIEQQLLRTYKELFGQEALKDIANSLTILENKFQNDYPTYPWLRWLKYNMHYGAL